jgi:hypothetical protein
MFKNLIPIYRATGVVEYHDVVYIYLNRAHLNLTFDKCNRLIKAVEKPRTSLAPSSSDGQHFMQPLVNSRPVHALRGVRGSKQN